MRLGLCCTQEEGPTALAMGYEYVEYGASATEPSETTYLFFPGDVTMYGPEADALPRGKAIIDAASRRGVRLMALGSGDVRRAPKGMALAEAEEIFYDLAAALDHHAQGYGMRVAPESLHPAETNVGTSLLDLARELAARGAPYTADSYHALREREVRVGDLDFWREQVPFAPAHVHLGGYERGVPTADDPSLRAFAARLREVGYVGRASLECKRKGIPDPEPLRRLFDVE